MSGILRILIVASFRIAWCTLMFPFKVLVNLADRNNESTKNLADKDLIEALDLQIASLEKEKKYYQKQLKECTKEEKKIKLEHKVMSLNTQIMVLSKKVLKLREEIEK